MKELIDQVNTTELDRRQLLRLGGMTGLGLFAGGLLAGCGGSDGSSGVITGGGTTDQNVLNFALNLEYLEAEYYLRGTTGTGLSAGDSGTNPGAVTGGRQVNFSTAAFQQYAHEIAEDELAHVRFLRSALGGAAVTRPAINFTDAFNAAASAAGIGSAFDPFADEVSFLIGAFVFEDVGVTAYRGGARLISNKDFLSAAAGILGTEAYHAGTVRTLLNGLNNSTVNDATTKISNLRAQVGGGKDEPIVGGGATDPSNASNIVPTDANGIAFERTTREVLNIVYLDATGSAHTGGFFPNGLNGAVR